MNMLMRKKHDVCKQGDFKTKNARLPAVTAQFIKYEWGSALLSTTTDYHALTFLLR